MIDACKVVAEIRAAELVVALQAAVAGGSHWRSHAQHLLRSIADLELPAHVSEALHTIDARKRAAEIMDDLSMHDTSWSDCSG